MTRLYAILVSLVLAAGARGDFPHDAVCKVYCGPYGGSGTLIGTADGRGLVISASHVFENCNRNAITCQFPTINRVFRGRVVGENRQYDIAALDIEAPEGIATPRVVWARPEDGPYTCVGYPWNGRGRQFFVRGDYLGYPRGRGMSAWAPSMLHTSTHVISGYSGGARFNKHGEYVGVVSGMTGDSPQQLDRTWGAAGDALLKFVGRFMEVGKR